MHTSSIQPSIQSISTRKQIVREGLASSTRYNSPHLEHFLKHHIPEKSAIGERPPRSAKRLSSAKIAAGIRWNPRSNLARSRCVPVTQERMTGGAAPPPRVGALFDALCGLLAAAAGRWPTCYSEAGRFPRKFEVVVECLARYSPDRSVAKTMSCVCLGAFVVFRDVGSVYFLGALSGWFFWR